MNYISRKNDHYINKRSRQATCLQFSTKLKETMAEMLFKKQED